MSQRIALLLVVMLACNGPVFSQQDKPLRPGDALAGMSCMLFCFLVVAFPFILLLVNSACMFWVARDARSRGMDGAMWIFLMLFAGPIGLAIYLFSRSQGMLKQCEACGNNRLETSAKCPHCGNR